MTGGVISATITLKVDVTLLPAVSVAVQVTTLVPTANVESEGGVHEAVPAPSTSSRVAGGAYETTAPVSDDACAFTSLCDAIVGGISHETPSHVPPSLSQTCSSKVLVSVWA